MAAISKETARVFRGVDLTIGFTYTPPIGESREGITISAALHSAGMSQPVPASTLTFDPATGAVTARWEEEVTARLITGSSPSARFVRAKGGDTRVLFIKPIKVD